ncbi:GFA family protein [Terricaulis sp.]|uniref:GFA family protein n=1 Tax=Terricaulis sp. TaxID=2768686 RepID=UPI003782E076
MKLEGGCHCGAVRYAISAKPMQSMICHCRTCRRVSGGLVVAWITVDPAAFAITRGEPKPYSSSPGVARSFCCDCGAQLTYAREDDASYIDITTTTLDDPDPFPPSHHSWLSHDIAWVKFGDDLPKYRKSRADGV